MGPRRADFVYSEREVPPSSPPMCRMKKIKLTPEQETTLKSQVFDAIHPGALLHDFALVLDYVGDKGVKAGGKYNLLPIDAIHPLDERLVRPMRLELQRPQLRSHPYLQGLHL